jgi:hypothetical protein
MSNEPSPGDLEARLAADREALAFHLRQAQEGVAVQRERSLPLVTGGAAVVGGLLLIRALAGGRRRGAARHAVHAAPGRTMARATRALGLVTAAWRLWPQLRALAHRVQAERSRVR